MRFRKRLLGSERYVSGDAVLEATPEKRQHWAQQFARMREAGLRFPVYWGHPTDHDANQPYRGGISDDRVREMAGTLEDFRVIDDGQAVEVVIDVPRAEDADRVRNNLGEISPVFFTRWIDRDGDGQVWEDVVTGVDIVSRPADHRQTPFEVDEPVRCSIRLSTEGKTMVFRMANGDGNGNADATAQRVIEALAAMDIILPEDTDRENFWERAEAALLTANAKDSEEGPPEPEEKDEDEEQQLEAAAPVAMLSRDPRGAAAFSVLEKQHRATLGTRLETLFQSGRCFPHEYEKFSRQVGAIRLSVDTRGNLKKGQLEQWVESREALPPGACWDPGVRTARLGLTPVDRPSFADVGEISSERADEIADEALTTRSRRGLRRTTKA